MTPTAETVELGHIGSRPPPRPADRRGRLFYSDRADAILAVETRTEVGWRCRVIARRHPDLDTSHLDATDDEIAAAPTTVLADPTDRDGYAMLWQARMWQHRYGGHTTTVARLLAEHLRRPGTLTVDLDPAAVRRLVYATGLRTPGLRRLLDRLTNASLLTRQAPGYDGGLGVHTLTLPDRGGHRGEVRP